MAQILLLEPDTRLGGLYQRALKHKGHSVQWCRDAQAAIQAADTTKPDVLITELQLAQHNGIEFLYEFRSYSEWQNTPVIVLSHVPPQSHLGGQVLWDQLNIAAYHYKPYTRLRDITNTVGQVLTPVS